MKLGIIVPLVIVLLIIVPFIGYPVLFSSKITVYVQMMFAVVCASVWMASVAIGKRS
jgi:hypothetical protein